MTRDETKAFLDALVAGYVENVTAQDPGFDGAPMTRAETVEDFTIFLRDTDPALVAIVEAK